MLGVKRSYGSDHSSYCKMEQTLLQLPLSKQTLSEFQCIYLQNKRTFEDLAKREFDTNLLR